MVKKLLYLYFIISLNQSLLIFADPGKNDLQGNKQLNDEYLFKPGDGLFISTFPDTSSFLNGTFSIDENGCVEFPIIGRVKITQMKKSEIIDFIKGNFQQFTRSQNIYIKPMLRVSVLGGVVRPGLYYFDYNSSLWELLQMVGGTVKEDGLKKMHWERDRDNVVGDLIPFYETGVSLKKMGFKSGDQLWSPSPDAKTFWDRITGDILPVLTFGTTIVFFYLTYQQSMYLTRIRIR